MHTCINTRNIWLLYLSLHNSASLLYCEVRLSELFVTKFDADICSFIFQVCGDRRCVGLKYLKTCAMWQTQPMYQSGIDYTH
ncbi:hypothetical protein L1887_19928 [Cichorium endivia]|nr:hypothetical protein L1887_19928 [Cichorium endivia]